MRPILRTLAVAASLSCALAAHPAFADDGGKITIMVGGIAKLIYLPARLTQELGYFKAEGPMSSCCRSRPASTPRTNCWQAPCRVWSASTTTRSTCRARART